MNSTGAVSRRVFITASAVAGGGLALAIWARRFLHEPPLDPATAALAPDAWVRLGTDGWLTVIVARSEMGQGVSTALPMLVAEEMDADWDRVHFEFAPANAAYYNPAMGVQATGGSTAVMTSWLPLRQAGATARAMLLAAAAERLGVPLESLRTDGGAVVHDSSGRRLEYGDLAEAAGQLPVPADIPLKEPAQFRLIGTDRRRLDTRDKVTGRAVFGIDAGPEDALVAVVARSPVFGGRLKQVDDTAARAVPGVRDVVRISSGVAVVADGYWAAARGREALVLAWDDGDHAGVDDASISRTMRELADGTGRSVRVEGDVEAALGAAATTVEAEYELPYLAHVCMEPMNCTADVRADGVTVWAPTQFQAGPRYMAGGGTRGAAARIAGVSLDEVEVITTYLGGGFGRRAEVDFVVDACETSRAVGRPVRVIYSREDDLRHDFYRPASFHRLSAAQDATGQPTAWRHRIVSPSILRRFIPGAIPDFVAHLGGPMKGGVDPAAVEGIADLPYAVGAMDITYSEAELGVPVGYWRSVGHASNAFVVESFVDELAAAAGVDPVAYRRRLLADHPRHLAVLEAAATAAGWGTPVPEGRARGVAVHESFGSFVAQVAEVSVEEGRPRVHRVTCALDCGVVVNPDTVRAQMEGGIGFGLSAALGERVAIAGGRAVPGNFNDYRILTMSEMPVVDVVLLPSGDAPGGVGEPGTPPIAPAVCNALFVLLGQRIRRLPIELS
ncbi:MAG: molybdopterin cofactor-binding domain-containing protein [Gemmatimonadales bacterium]